jgi:hypothetical protein
VIKGGPTKGIKGFNKERLDFNSGHKCSGIYNSEASGEACKVNYIYLLTAISSYYNLVNN